MVNITAGNKKSSKKIIRNIFDPLTEDRLPSEFIDIRATYNCNVITAK